MAVRFRSGSWSPDVPRTLSLPGNARTLEHFWPCMPSFAQPWGNQSPSPVCPGGCPPPYPVRRGILILSKTREQTLLALYAFVCQPWGNQSPSPVCPGACPPPTPYTGEFSYTQTHSNKHFWPCMQSAKTWGLSPTCPVRREFSYTQ